MLKPLMPKILPACLKDIAEKQVTTKLKPTVIWLKATLVFRAGDVTQYEVSAARLNALGDSA